MDFNIQRYKKVFLDINETNEKISNLSSQLKKKVYYLLIEPEHISFFAFLNEPKQ